MDFSNYKALLNSTWAEYKRLLFNEPPRYIRSAGNVDAKKQFQPIYDELIHCLSDRDLSAQPTFFIGPWGSGKTTHLKSFTQQYSDRFRFIHKSFVSVRTLDEALFFLTSFWEKIAGLSFLVLIAYFYDLFHLPTAINFFTIAFYWILFLAFTNKFKLFYATSKLVSNIFLFLVPWARSKLPKVFILEDLDRSSILEFEKLALLSNLWYDQNLYIISLGYEKEEELSLIYSWANKLEGNMIFLPLIAQANYQIAKRFMPHFPFSQHVDWLELLIPREIIADILSIKKLSLLGEGSLARQIRVVNTFWNTLLNKLEISEKGDTRFTIQVDDNSKMPTLNIEQDTPHARRAKRLLSTFLQSIDPNFIAKILPDRDEGSIRSLTHIWQGILSFHLDPEVLTSFKEIASEVHFNPQIGNVQLKVGGP